LIGRTATPSWSVSSRNCLVRFLSVKFFQSNWREMFSYTSLVNCDFSLLASICARTQSGLHKILFTRSPFNIDVCFKFVHSYTRQKYVIERLLCILSHLKSVVALSSKILDFKHCIDQKHKTVQLFGTKYPTAFGP